MGGPHSAAVRIPRGLETARSVTRSLPRESPLRYLAGIAALIVLYYGSAQLGYALQFAGPVAAVVWLPVGVAIAFLLLAGLEFWPGVVAGDLLVNNYSAIPVGSALGQTAGNLLEAVVAALLLRRIAMSRSLNDDVGGVWRSILAIALGTAISATIGTLSLRAGGVLSGGLLPKAWRTWWLGDFSGALLVVPLVAAWSRRDDVRHRHWRLIEVVLSVTALVAASELAWRATQPLSYIVFPVLIWIAFRFGPRGATSAVLLASGFAVWATTAHVGPFSAHTFAHAVLATQLFIAAASISSQCLAAVVYERQRFARRLWASRARLVHAADGERRRLERNLHDGAQQRLAGLMVRLELLAEGTGPPALESEKLRAVRAELGEALEELRQLAHGRNPAVLAEQGLATAVGEIARRSPVPIETLAIPQQRLSEPVEATAYFVVAEAVTNAQKHARASVIRIRVLVSGGYLRIEVEDNGSGGATVARGSGLEGLQDRVETFGGKLRVDSSPGRGTRISARIPVSPA